MLNIQMTYAMTNLFKCRYLIDNWSRFERKRKKKNV